MHITYSIGHGMRIHDHTISTCRRTVLSPILLPELTSAISPLQLSSEHRKDAAQSTPPRREHRSPSNRSAAPRPRLIK